MTTRASQAIVAGASHIKEKSGYRTRNKSTGIQPACGDRKEIAP
jgi:hypothetical protein